MDAKTMTMPNGDVINLKDDVARAKIGTGTLDTESKELIGAVNELKQSLDKIQHGASSSAVSVSSNSFADDTITFPVAFSSTPSVIITPTGSGDNAYRGQISIFIVSITKTTCSIRIFNASAATLSVGYRWIATNL